MMSRWNFLAAIGRIFISFLNSTGHLILFTATALRHVVLPPFFLRITFQQMLRIGYFSLPVVGLTAIFTGAVLALQIYIGGSRFNAEGFVGQVVVISMVRELGPVLAALMLAGRVSSAIAAEIGTMRVTEQIDALYTLATNPMKYLVVPRFLASTIMMFFLSALGMYIGILGGYFVGVKVLGTNPTTYMNQSINNTTMSDIWYGLIKSLVFGAVVGLIGCYKGFNTEGGAEGVGKATTGAVVMSCMLILILDYFLSALLW